MALSDDQRALLQLLLERDQSYEDLASLLGTELPEVRRRARGALTELAGSDPDQDVALSDYLLGEADPIARADVVRHLQGDAETLDLARELSAKLQLVAPDAELPELPEGKAKAKRRAAPTKPSKAEEADDDEAPSERTGGISSSQSRIIAGIGAGALLLLIVIVLAITGGSNEEEAPPQTADATTPAGGTATEEGTRVVLQATDGSDARGLVALGFTSGDQGVVEGALEGLPEPDTDHVYLLWFLNEDNQGFFLLNPIPVEKDGSAVFQAPVSTELLPLIQDARFIDIATLDRDQLRNAVAAFRTALESQEDSLAFIGNSVLRGEIPRTASGT